MACDLNDLVGQFKIGVDDGVPVGDKAVALDLLAKKLSVEQQKAQHFRYYAETYQQIIICALLFATFTVLNWRVLGLIDEAHANDTALNVYSITRFEYFAKKRELSETNATGSSTGSLNNAPPLPKIPPDLAEKVRNALGSTTDTTPKASNGESNNKAELESPPWAPQVVSSSVVIALISALVVQVGAAMAVIVGYLFRKPTDQQSIG